MILSLDKYQRHIPFGTTMTTAISDKNDNKKPRIAGIYSLHSILAKGEWIVYSTISNTLHLKVADVTRRKT